MSPAAQQRSRPVVLPFGMPKGEPERDCVVQILRTCGADFARMIELPGAPSTAFVKHVSRMAVLRSERECPLVLLDASTVDVVTLLDVRQAVLKAVPELRSAAWLVFVPGFARRDFIKGASRHGGSFDFGDGLVTWHVSGTPMALVGSETKLAGLADRLTEFLEPVPESGIINHGPFEPPASLEPCVGFAVTEPAPPSTNIVLGRIVPVTIPANRRLRGR